MVEIAKFVTIVDAENARALLAAAGIPCVLSPGDPRGGYPVDASGGTHLLVAEADADEAFRILAGCASDRE